MYMLLFWLNVSNIDFFINDFIHAIITIDLHRISVVTIIKNKEIKIGMHKNKRKFFL